MATAPSVAALSSPLDAALYYASVLGWAVFPLHTARNGRCSCPDPQPNGKPGGARCESKGKHPRTERGLNDASKDPAKIQAWWKRWPDAQVGVATGEASGFVVLDVDVSKGKPGRESLARLEAEFGALPSAPTSITGSGGDHLLFALPGAALTNSTSKVGQGLDVRANGGYIVAPPSLHESGGVYRWREGAEPWILSPAAMPLWLFEKARKAPRLVPDAPVPAPGDHPLSERMRRASAYLARVPGAVSGERGHDTTWAAALPIVRGFDLPRGVAIQILLEEYNPRCRPPWTREEIEHKVDGALVPSGENQPRAGYLLDDPRRARPAYAAPSRTQAPSGPGVNGAAAMAEEQAERASDGVNCVDQILEAVREAGTGLEGKEQKAAHTARALAPDLLSVASTIDDGSPEGLSLRRELKALGITAQEFNAALKWFRAKAKRRTPVDWEKGLGLNKQGDIRANVANAITILQCHPDWQGVLAWDDFRDTIIFRSPPPWHDHDRPQKTERGDEGRYLTDANTTSLTAWLSRNYKIDLSDEHTYKAARTVAQGHGNRINSLTDWLDSLRWDASDRIGSRSSDGPSWLTTYLGVADTPYTRFVGRVWLVSAIARAYRPGCQADLALILEGQQGRLLNQGSGKSSALRILFAEYFSESPLDMHSKDRFVNLRGVWCQSFDELASFGKTSKEIVKNFITSLYDIYRPPYGRDSVKVDRRCVFSGTLNPKGLGYFEDETGNRRYLPVTCGVVHPVDLEGLARDRELIWAQARELYQSGVKWHPVTDEEKAFCNEEQEQRVEADVWDEPVLRYLRGLSVHTTTMADVLSNALRIEVKDHAKDKAPARVSRILTRLGWLHERPSIDGVRMLRYRRPEPAALEAQLARAREDLTKAEADLEAAREKVRRLEWQVEAAVPVPTSGT